MANLISAEGGDLNTTPSISRVGHSGTDTTDRVGTAGTDGLAEGVVTPEAGTAGKGLGATDTARGRTIGTVDTAGATTATTDTAGATGTDGRGAMAIGATCCCLLASSSSSLASAIVGRARSVGIIGGWDCGSGGGGGKGGWDRGGLGG